MKFSIILIASLFAFAFGSAVLPASAQGDEWVKGTVIKVDEPAQKITIKHGPIKKFDMDEGMTMVFRAGAPAMLKIVRPADKVRFVADRINGQFTITKIQKVK